MSDQPRTPLTLEFEPDNIDEGFPEDYKSIIVCEPSFQEGGRIFLGVNPVGNRVGVHMLPDDARTLRDHLSKLLLEPTPEVTEGPAPLEAVEARLGRAVERAKKRLEAEAVEAKTKKRWNWLPKFRFEFSIGSVQGVIGTVGRD